MTTSRIVESPGVSRPAAAAGSAPPLARGRRTVAAVVVAIVALLLAGYVAWQAILVQTNQRPFPLDAAAISARLNQTPWSDIAVVVTGAVLILVGLWLLVLAIVPPRSKLVELRESHPDVTTGIRAGDLRRALNGAAERVDGISAATTSVNRGVASVTVTSPLGNPAGLVERVNAELVEQLHQLDPLHRITPRVTLEQGGRP